MTDNMSLKSKSNKVSNNVGTASIRIENLTHKFGKNSVVSDVTFEVSAGEVVCLLGPSGCGKTTILRIAAGIEALQKGRIFIDNIEVAGSISYEMPAEKRRIGMVFQDYALFPHLTVEGNINFGLKGFSKYSRKKIVEELLEGVNLSSYASKYPHTLSGGEQQRVALLRALAPNPCVMLLDEPFSGLDVKLRSKVRDDAISILRKRGVATLFVTHDFEEAMISADRIILMHQGRIVQTGQPEDLYVNPKNKFVASFFGEINTINTKVINGQIHTIFGTLTVPQENESNVSLMVRPEDLFIKELTNNSENSQIIVKSKRDIGAFTLMQLTQITTGEDIFARVLTKNAPKVGSKVLIQLDQERAFVFPAI